MKAAVSVIFCAAAVAFTGCASDGSSVGNVGASLEFSKTDRKMAGKVTLVELDVDGFEQSRTDEPSAVFKGLGLSESAIADAATDEADGSSSGLDYSRFDEGDGFAEAQYPAGRTGHRRLEFMFTSPSKRCESMNYTLQVQWRWRSNRVTESRVSGDWNNSAPSTCMQGLMRAEKVDGMSGSRRMIGMDKFVVDILFRAPLESQDGSEVDEPATSDANHYFGNAVVTVRGDGTARFYAKYGVAGK